MHKIFKIILWNEEISVILQTPQPPLGGELQMSKTTKRILTVVGWVVATPLILILLLFVALYIPPVQKWAVDLTADYLSKETGMEVSVEHVLLKFPLDLSMGNVLIVSPPDTVLDAEELLVNVQLLPLMKGEVKIDHMSLTNTKVNTLDLIDAEMREITQSDLTEIIADVTADYREPVPGACVRLRTALNVIVLAYYSSLVKIF